MVSALQILEKMEIPCSCVYSSLDQTARKIAVNNFKSKTVKILLVTDVAARGIDIPLLDNVVNFSFPAKPKLFVHRVGRVARAGRFGTAYSFVSPDEAAYLQDLHLFLDKPLKFAERSMSEVRRIPHCVSFLVCLNSGSVSGVLV